MLPAHLRVQIQLFPDPALHLLSLKLHPVLLAFARAAAATALASGYFPPRSEPAKVIPLKVKGQTALPSYDILERIFVVSYLL